MLQTFGNISQTLVSLLQLWGLPIAWGLGAKCPSFPPLVGTTDY